MTHELYWLALTTLMTAFMWLPYIIDRLAVRGIGTALTEGGPETHERQSLWAQRAIRAHINAVENLVVFATVVLIAHAAGISNGVTQGAVVVYFFARLAHYVIYTLGIPVARTISFAVGWAAQIVILMSILGML